MIGKKCRRTIALLLGGLMGGLVVLSAALAEDPKSAAPAAVVEKTPRSGILISGPMTAAAPTPDAAEPPPGMPSGVPGAPGGAGEMVAVENVPSPAGTIPELDPVKNVKPAGASQEKISLDLKGIDVNEFFRVLSMKMGVTIVPTRSVSGRINIYLNNLTYEDALDVVLFSQDLAAERRPGVIDVMTSAEYERLYGKKYNEKRKLATYRLVYAKPAAVFEALGQLKSDIGRIIADESTGTLFVIDIPEKVDLMIKTIKDLDQPPETQVFTLQYAKPADVKTHLANVSTIGVGEVYVDERSNKVMVSDLPQKMRKIRTMIKAFDEPTKEVFIEGEVVQVTLRDENTRGVNWEKLFQSDTLNGLDFKGTFPLSSSFTPSPGLSSNNLKISIGTLAQNGYMGALQLLQSMGNAKLLSEPRIAVLNKEEAKIMVGSREAFVTQALSQGQSTTVTSESIQFTDVGVKLTVAPTINDDGYVLIKIKPEVSSVREVITTSLGSRIPIVETSEAETMVKVRDGTMIMIAGLMKDEKYEDVSGIPMLAKVPVVGALFGSKAKQTKKTELIIFITPHIITGDVTVAGTEPKKLVPPEIMPDHIKQRYLERSMAEIVPNAKPKLIDSPEKGLTQIKVKKADPIKKAPLVKKAVIKSPNEDEIQNEMKGLKDF